MSAGVKYAQQRARHKLKNLCPHSIPERPWQVVGTDIFQLGDFHFLILVDYWSDFWELDRLSDMTSATVILHLRRQFARYGIPEKLVSDNSPQFSCEQFKSNTKHFLVLTPAGAELDLNASVNGA